MAELEHINTDQMLVQSLVWSGDGLVDWVAGGTRYGLDGSIRMRSRMYAFRFDGAVATRDGSSAVIFERTGTKGLVLRDGEVQREINRSYYQAHAYEYPVCLWTTGDGRTLMAHCPDEYNRIEIDDFDTGERLTKSSELKPSDFFYSRLQVNPGGTRLLSAGWVWHPFDCVEYFDIAQVQREPTCLDSFGGPRTWGDEDGLVEDIAACWQTNDRLIIAGGGEEESSGEGETPRLHPNGIVVYDIPSDTCIHSLVLRQPAGTLMPVGADHVVAFYEYPRLISLADGGIVDEWPEISSGNQTSSINMGGKWPPPMALDPANHRFAVAQEDRIHVVTL